jgi:hypothetical protein
MNSKDIHDLLKNWPKWFFTLLFLIPGILYQLKYQKIDILTYSGSLVIIFFLLSIYYTIPFLILGFVFSLNVLNEGGLKERFNLEDWALISMTSIGSYFVVSLLTKSQSFTIVYFGMLILGIIFNFNGLKKMIRASKHASLKKRKKAIPKTLK